MCENKKNKYYVFRLTKYKLSVIWITRKGVIIITNRMYDKNRDIRYISRTTTYIDEDGNEGQQTEIYKKIYGGKHFWRVWLTDLLQALDLVNDNKQMDVLFYILENTSPHDNVYLGTIRQTAKESGISPSTVAKIMKKLQDTNFMVKKSSGVYKIKPSLLMKGDNTKRARMVIEYEKLKAEREGEKFDKATMERE